MRVRITKKKTAAVVAATTVVALGAGAAMAFWTSTGSGDGEAEVGMDFPVVFDSVTVGDLFPGEELPLTVTVQNPNDFDVFLANGIAGGSPEITVAEAMGADALGPNDCTAADFDLLGSTPAINIPTGDGVMGTPEATISGVFSILMLEKPVDPMDPDANNQNQCKGATVTINYAAS